MDTGFVKTVLFQ